MYQQDFSQHKYHRQYPANVLAIGWLERGHEFPIGKTEQEILEGLRRMRIVNGMRGYHRCFFCESAISSDYHRALAIGAMATGEIWVKGEGVTYAMPSMVIHYISHHAYKLPPEVEAAIRRSGKSVLQILMRWMFR